MPGFDRTGPVGAGPATGRGLGYCGNGTAVGAYGFGRGRAGFGRGYGAGFGRGFGYGRGYYAPPVYAPLVEDENLINNELVALKQQKSWLEDQEKALNERLQSLKKDDGK